MSDQNKNFFSGKPKMGGREKLGILLVFVIGALLSILKLFLVSDFFVKFPAITIFEETKLWLNAINTWNNNSPAFRGYATGLLKIDLLGMAISIIISLATTKTSTLKSWVTEQENKLLVIVLIVLFFGMFSDYVASFMSNGIEKDDVGILLLFTHNSILGLLLKTYVSMYAAYYFPSAIRMLILKAKS